MIKAGEPCGCRPLCYALILRFSARFQMRDQLRRRRPSKPARAARETSEKPMGALDEPGIVQPQPPSSVMVGPIGLPALPPEPPAPPAPPAPPTPADWVIVKFRSV